MTKTRGKMIEVYNNNIKKFSNKLYYRVAETDEQGNFYITDGFSIIILKENPNFDIRNTHSLYTTFAGMKLNSVPVKHINSYEELEHELKDSKYGFDLLYYKRIIKILGESKTTVNLIKRPGFDIVFLYFINKDGEDAILLPFKDTKKEVKQ